VQYWAELTQLAGAGLATFLATWLALVRPLAGKVKHSSSPEALEAIRAGLREAERELDRAVERLEAVEREAHRTAQALDRIEQKMGRTVTAEEFGTYTQAIQQSLQALAEKLGHATGSIEAWARSQMGGR
jgi:DNA repair ATPase RecN